MNMDIYSRTMFLKIIKMRKNVKITERTKKPENSKKRKKHNKSYRNRLSLE